MATDEELRRDRFVETSFERSPFTQAWGDACRAAEGNSDFDWAATSKVFGDAASSQPYGELDRYIGQRYELVAAIMSGDQELLSEIVERYTSY